MRDYKLYLKDILAASNAILHFIDGMDFEQFCDDDKTVSAVIKKLEIIGEAARKKFRPEITLSNLEIPWKEMAGMRDILIHSYFGTEFAAVWNAAKISIPELISQIEKLLKNLEQ